MWVPSTGSPGVHPRNWKFPTENQKKRRGTQENLPLMKTAKYTVAAKSTYITFREIFGANSFSEKTPLGASLHVWALNLWERFSGRTLDQPPRVQLDSPKGRSLRMTPKWEARRDPGAFSGARTQQTLLKSQGSRIRTLDFPCSWLPALRPKNGTQPPRGASMDPLGTEPRGLGEAV